jgi:RNA polymerase sigma factor (sigma-70 family)
MRASEAVARQSGKKFFSKKRPTGAFTLEYLMSSSPPNPRVPEHADTGYLARTFAEQRAPLLRYATRLLGDRERAEDVVQDTFMRFMGQQAEAIDGHAVEWLFTVCRNRALDVIRKESRMKRFEEGQVERVTASDPRPGRAIEEAETHAALLRLIDRLPPSQQEVIRLKFQNGFSYQEIARITEKSIGNVGFLIHTAVARLRAEFAAQRP